VGIPAPHFPPTAAQVACGDGINDLCPANGNVTLHPQAKGLAERSAAAPSAK